MQSIFRNDHCVDIAIPALPSGSQEYLVTLKIDDVTCGTKSTTIHDVLQWATEVLRHLVVKFDFGASWSHFPFFPQNNVILISFSTAQTSAPSQP